LEALAHLPAIDIPPSKQAKFKAAKQLKDALN
jgi:nucleoid DNA-binding protein